MRAEVRRVRPHDWRELRGLRLEALQDTPIAYCERYADAVRFPDEEWQRRAAAGAEGGPSFLALAWAGPRPVAMCEGYRDGDDAGLGAVYVTQSHRGMGVLDEMVAQVVDWATRQEAARLRLLVHETNRPAQEAYRRLGFGLTGRREPYPLDPATDELEMVRDLGAS